MARAVKKRRRTDRTSTIRATVDVAILPERRRRREWEWEQLCSYPSLTYPDVGPDWDLRDERTKGEKREEKRRETRDERDFGQDV